jgi:maltose O-acetyltransferase
VGAVTGSPPSGLVQRETGFEWWSGGYPYRVDLPFNIWVNSVASSPAVPARLRPAFMRAAGLDVDSSAYIRPRFFVVMSRDVRIEESAFINARCIIDGPGAVRVGRNAWVGVDVAFLTSTHEVGSSDQRAGTGIHEKIVVEDGAWIGAKASIFGGVTIGRGAIVGAGAVVREDVAPNTVVAGVPARVIRELGN